MTGPRILLDDPAVRELIEAAVGAFNRRSLDQWMAFYAEKAIHVQPGRPDPLRGHAAIRQDYLDTTWTPFPDFHIELSLVFGTGDWICVEGILTGTHTGPLIGPDGESVAPTHKRIRVPVCLIIRLEDGQLAEVHEYNDQLGLLAQLGLTP